MPALIICGHRSKLGGDDLSPICIVIGTIRLMEAILLVPAATLTYVEYQHRLDEECMGHRSHKVRIGILPLPMLAISLCFAIFTVCLSIQMYRISGRGSPTQPEARKGMGLLFSIQMFVTPLILVGLVVAGISGILYVDSRIGCIGHIDSQPKWFNLLIAVVSFMCFELLIYTIVLIHWLRIEMRDRIVPEDDDAAKKTIEERAEELDRSCRCCCKYTSLCCCFSFGGRGIHNEDFSSAAQVLTELFDGGGTLDIVFTDVVAAAMAIAFEQEDRQRKHMERLKREADGDPNSLALLQQAATSNNAVPIIGHHLEAILSVTLGRNIETGMTSTGVSPTPTPNTHRRKDRDMTLVFVKNPLNDEQFAVRELLSPEIDVDRYAIAEGARFLRYSIAINAAKGYIFGNPSANCCKLTYARCCELPKHRQQEREGIIVGDGSAGLDEAALMKVIGFDTSKAELLYAHLVNAVGQAVYCIVVDHVWESVVLCIRGSLSLEDYVVNLQIDAEKLDAVGAEYGFDGEGEYCHKGYLARAKWVCEDLKRHQILQNVLNKETGKYRDYSLRVSGHSLGAGTAAPVALMLRSRYPNLRCLCFAPPGGLFSEGIAARSKDFVSTYVHADDVVPRISTQAIEKLRDEALQMIARIKVPKCQLMRIHRSGKKLGELTVGLEDLLHPIDAIPDCEFKAQLERFKQRQRVIKTARVHLHLPGRIVHLVREISGQEQRNFHQGRFQLGNIFHFATCDLFVAEEKYTPRYAAPSDFDDIVVSSKLVSDHMVETVEVALNFAAEAFGVDPSSCTPSMKETSQ